jgi:protein-S-isoprenylcysteine O-methyltransferase Ste14
MNYNKVIYGFLGAAVLLALALLYLVLLRSSQAVLSPSRWLLFVGCALPVVAAAILPFVVHRVRRARCVRRPEDRHSSNHEGGPLLSFEEAMKK